MGWIPDLPQSCGVVDVVEAEVQAPDEAVGEVTAAEAGPRCKKTEEGKPLERVVRKATGP
jgi:hypothetical protein